jgi:hypothetical protein
MGVTLLAPEIIIGKACSEVYSARKYGKWLHRLAQEDGVQWTTAHSFYADMGGFVLEFDRVDTEEDAEQRNVARSPHIENSAADSVRRQSSSAVAQGVTADITNGSKMPDDLEAQPLRQVGSPNAITQAAPRSETIKTVIQPEGPEEAYRVSKESSNSADLVEFVEDRMEKFPGPGMEKLKSQGRLHWEVDPQYSIMAQELLAEVFIKNGEPYVWGPNDDDRPEYADEEEYDTFYAQGVTVLRGKIWVLQARQLIRARELGVIDKLPNLRDAELADKDKSDIIVKGLAFAQITWLISQLSSRWRDGKACSQLEIMTLSFAVASIFIFVLYWSRPHEITAPSVVHANRATKKQMKDIAMLGHEPFSSPRLYTIPNLSFYSGNPAFVWGGFFGTFLFGAFHLIAWEFVFPTDVERVLWRVSSFITVLGPIAIVAMFIVYGALYLSGICHRHPYDARWLMALVSLSVVVFVLARLFLIVESFRSLYFLPPDAFTATWAGNMPHLS